MEEDLNTALRSYEKKHRQRRTWHKVLWVLGCLTVFCTTYALILPAITMESTAYCGVEEHCHAEACYEETLLCGQEEAEDHQHTEACWGKTLTCPLPEHTHSLACFSNPEADVETAEDWEKTVSDAELTGNYAADLLQIAWTQLGYRESEENYLVETDPDTGAETVKGYTRYGDWYGDSYGDWCAMFCAFCLHYANIPAEDFPRSASCPDWAALLLWGERKLYHAKGDDYTPAPGDLVFFDWNQDGEADRVGVAASLGAEEDGSVTLTVIEGDSDNMVQTQAYSLAEEAILGYGQLPLSEYQSIYDAMAELLGEIRNLENDEEAQALCLDAYLRLCDLLDAAYEGSGEGRVTEEQLRSLEALFEEALAVMLDTCGFDPYGTSAAAYTAGTEDTDWGYHGDGSIYWTDPKLEPATEIEEGVGYAISSSSGARIMTNAEYTVTYTYTPTDSRTWTLSENEYNTCMTAVAKPSAVSDYPQYEVWYFEKAADSGQYYIYTLIDGAKKYLNMSQQAWRNDGTNESMQLTLADAENKTAFSVQILADTEKVRVFTVVEGTDGSADKYFYLNLAGGESGPYGYFWGWKNPANTTDAGCMLQIGRYVTQHTASPVETVSPASTIINLFDYWATDERFSANDQNPELGVLVGGINVGHTLQFDTRKIGNFTGKTEPYVNAGTGSTRLTQGIVANTLGADKYPYLAGTPVTDGSTESLAYLFDTSRTETGKASYRDVQGLLQVDAQGYYYYDSRYNMAEFPIDAAGNSTNHNSFVVYDKPGVYPNVTGNEGEFFPFNKAPQVAALNANNTQNANAENKILNHYFGMTLTTRFIQEHGGYTDADQKTATSFHFSGDDDVWIFIDDVLVADLGGKHIRVGVTIDFASGTIQIDGQDSTGSSIPATTLQAAFDAAGKTAVEWQTNTASDGTVYTTFKDGSTHTLKFYYLERGNYDSNLDLKFNLTEIPPTSIYKVDQYGDALEGAVFAAYPADKVYDKAGDGTALSTFTYQYLLDSGTSSPWVDSWYIDPSSGDVYDKEGGNILITAGYYGRTDSSGSMMFSDEDGMPFTEAELKKKLTGSETGEYFILREISIPSGYRTVSAETWLSFSGSNMICDNTYQSGVWASPNAMVVATNTLYVADAYQNSSIGTNNGIGKAVTYYNPETGTTTGTLFAVVLKRNGAALTDVDSWYPLYGSDVEGYTVLDTPGIESVIAAAKAQADPANHYGGSSVFQYSASGMKATLENLPGKITRYYTYIQNQEDPTKLLKDLPNAEVYQKGEDPQYFVAYYYTTADSVTGAAADNTVRVISRQGVLTKEETVTDADTGEEITTTKSLYNGFSIQWGTTIEVPNMENRLFFQKTNGEQNEDGTPVLLDGAVFALYEAYAADSTKTQDTYIYYVGRDASGGTVYVGILDSLGGEGYDGHAVVFSGTPALLGYGVYSIDTAGLSEETIDKTTGVITDPSATLGQITVTMTDDSRNTAAAETTYYVNPAANAKSETLVGVTHDTCEYVSEAGTGHFTNLADGKYYLREIYAPDGYELNTTDIPVLVNNNGVYAYAGDYGEADNGVTVGNGTGYLTQTLDVFASPGEIDETLTWVYAVLLQNNTKGFAEFDKVSGDVIRVTEKNSWHFVGKGTETRPGYGDELINVGLQSDKTTVLTSEQARDSAMKTYMVYDGKLATQLSKELIFDYVPNPAHTGGEGQIRLFTDEGWSDLAIYQDYAYGSAHRANLSGSNATFYEDLTGLGNISNLFSSSTFVRVTDEKSITTADLQIQKVDMVNEDTRLSGARFRLYRIEAGTAEDGTVTETTQYYSRTDDGVTWVADADQAMAVTTGADGLAVFTGLEQNTYYLEEISAPDGYQPLTETIRVQIKDTLSDTGAVLVSPVGTASGIHPAATKTVIEDGTETDTGKWLGTIQEDDTYLYTLVIPNSTGYALPATGGTGTAAICRLGILLTLGACALLLRRKRAYR